MPDSGANPGFLSPRSAPPDHDDAHAQATPTRTKFDPTAYAPTSRSSNQGPGKTRLLDNGATSKAAPVIHAITRYYESRNATSPAAYTTWQLATELYEAARRKGAAVINAADPAR